MVMDIPGALQTGRHHLRLLWLPRQPGGISVGWIALVFLPGFAEDDGRCSLIFLYIIIYIGGIGISILYIYIHWFGSIYIYSGIHHLDPFGESMVDLCCFFVASPSAELNFRQHPYEVNSLFVGLFLIHEKFDISSDSFHILLVARTPSNLNGYSPFFIIPELDEGHRISANHCFSW